MRELLADNDPVVARYVLGLVPSSTVKGALIKQAKECRHNVDASFREDLKLLCTMTGAKEEV